MFARPALRRAAVAASMVFTLLAAPTAAKADLCLYAPMLGTSSHQTSYAPGAGVDVTTFDFAAGVSNGTFFKTRVSVAASNLASNSLNVTRFPVGRAGNQISLATNSRALAYINGDYFTEANGMPYSAVIEGGSLIYAPLGTSRVVGTAVQSYSYEHGFPLTYTFRLGITPFHIDGVNQTHIKANGITAITNKYASGDLPSNSGGLLIYGAKVSKVYKSAVTAKPSKGVLLLSNSTTLKKLLKLSAGLATTFVLPKVPAPALQLDYATVHSSGSISANGLKVRIDGVNVDASSSNARVYDSNYLAGRATQAGSYTIVLNADSKVIAKYRSRGSVVPSGGQVLQLGSAGSTFYSGVSVGTVVTVTKGYTATGDTKFVNAIGASAHGLQGGVNTQLCSRYFEAIRPRTSLGWNNSTGEVWLLTSSSGQDLKDYGFRMGGSSYHQMFAWLKQLGATDAVLEDGGGSTTMITNNGGSYLRIDIPPSAWLRDIPNGWSLTTKG